LPYLSAGSIAASRIYCQTLSPTNSFR